MDEKWVTVDWGVVDFECHVQAAIKIEGLLHGIIWDGMRCGTGLCENGIKLKSEPYIFSIY